MTVYELRIRRNFPALLDHSRPPFGADTLERFLAGARVRSISPAADGYDIAIQFARADYATALDELAHAFHQLGYGIAEVGIAEFATSWLEGAAIGAASGAAIGAATESAETFVLLLLGGFALGAIASAMRDPVKARFSANRLYQGGWQITKLDSPALVSRPLPA